MIIRDIQVLRGVAILLVVLQHYQYQLPAPEFLRQASSELALWRGVDLFFAISGFVVTRSLLDRHRLEGAMSFGPLARSDFLAFWIRRVWRLYPAALLWACIVLAFALVKDGSQFGLRALAASGAAAATGSANAYLVACVSSQYVSQWCAHPFLSAFYWSLSLEEQFYLALSLSILVLRVHRGAVLILLVGLVSMSLEKPTFSLAWAFRVESMALGMAMYFLWARFKHEPPRRSLCRAGIVVSLAALLGTNGPGVADSALCAFAASFAVACASFDGAFGKGPLSTGMSAVGRRSYSIYLCHMPLMLLCSLLIAHGAPSMGWPLAFPGTLLVIGLCSWLTHRLVEQPLAAHGREASARWLVKSQFRGRLVSRVWS